MPSTADDRIRWAVEVLSVEPADRLLEIGCGNGAAVSLICRKLAAGTVTAIDRSDRMIALAARRNETYAAAGRACFLTAGLLEADLPRGAFDKIFAVNVNLFWMKPRRELDVVRELLAPDGTLYLFNQPPSAGRLPDIAGRMRRNLLDAGFAVRDVLVGELQPVPVVCVTAGAEAAVT